MKKSKWVIVIALFCISLTAFSQTDSIVGKLTDLRPFNDEYALTVGNTTLVLIKNVTTKCKSKECFEINSKYKNILVKREGKYEINPKYINKTFKIIYSVNGKGWKCIKKIELAK